MIASPPCTVPYPCNVYHLISICADHSAQATQHYSYSSRTCCARKKTTLRIAVVVYFPSYILLEKPTLVNRNTSRRVKLCTSNTRLTELY